MRKKTLEHQWLEIMGMRRALDAKGADDLRRFTRGYSGELELDRLVAEFGGNGWRVYRDIWIQCGGITQIDTMIVTACGIYVCDAKNFSGNYVYEDGKWYAGGRELNNDIFVQLKRSMEKVNTMRDWIGWNIMTEGAILFVNEHFELEMKSSAFERVVTRNRIKKYMEEIDGVAAFGRFHVGKLCHEIEKYMIENPYRPPVCDDLMYGRLAKGIHCVGCGSYGVEVGHRFIYCSNCRTKEGKEKGVLRTICEYGVIMHHKDLRLQELYDFMREEVGKRYLKSILGRYCKLLTNGKHAKYKNPKQNFDYEYGLLNFFYKDIKKEGKNL